VRLSEQRKQAEQKPQVQQKSQIEPNKHSNVDKQATKITKKGLSFGQKKELEELPTKIEKEEQEVQRLQDVLADPNTYSDTSIQVAEIHKRLLVLEAKIETMYARWSELSDLES
jgi:ATP-binding cassette subfamily F protein uup